MPSITTRVLGALFALATVAATDIDTSAVSHSTTGSETGTVIIPPDAIVAATNISGGISLASPQLCGLYCGCARYSHYSCINKKCWCLDKKFSTGLGCSDEVGCAAHCTQKKYRSSWCLNVGQAPVHHASGGSCYCYKRVRNTGERCN